MIGPSDLPILGAALTCARLANWGTPLEVRAWATEVAVILADVERVDLLLTAGGVADLRLRIELAIGGPNAGHFANVLSQEVSHAVKVLTCLG